MTVNKIIAMSAVMFACVSFLVADDSVSVSSVIAESASNKWVALEGKMNTAKAEFSISGDAMTVAGAVSTEFKMGDPSESEFEATTAFFLPATNVAWASAAIALYARNPEQRIYFMTIFNQPGMAAEESEVCIYGHAQKRIKTVNNKWHRVKVGIKDGTAMMKIWQEGDNEPADWQVESELPVDMRSVESIGLRTYAVETMFKDLTAKTIKVTPFLTSIGDDKLKIDLMSSGSICKMLVNRSGKWDTIDFRRDGYKGPSLYVQDSGGTRNIKLKAAAQGQASYSAVQDGVSYGVSYTVKNGKLVISVEVANSGASVFSPERCSLMLGIDAEMVSYPGWSNKYFPTLLRCEKTHYWGYFMSPLEGIIAVSSPDPVASYTTHYNNGGHRIYTSSLDLMHEGPLPERHPQDVSSIAPGAKRKWTVIMQDVSGLQNVKPEISAASSVPMIDCDRYTVAEGEVSAVTVYSKDLPALSYSGPDGKTGSIELKDLHDGKYTASFKPSNGIGLYTLKVSDHNDHVAEAKISVLHPWSWYIQAARKEALNKVQIASSHTEGWYGFYSAYTARRVFPDKTLDSAVDEKFTELWPLMYDMQKQVPIAWHDRIQNHSAAAELMVDKYRATGDIKDLEFASTLADFILTKQSADGAYRSRRTHYTCVIYVAKNILTVALAEAERSIVEPRWAEKAKKHFDSVTRALEELAKNMDNIETEGEMTYEDGMISCSYAQLSMFALQQNEPALVKKYTDAAKLMQRGHQCLSQIIIPDSRMNGASLRYWESQYDVMMSPNMMNSPHGWSAWRVYGLWYLYLLTGEEQYIQQVANALGTDAQLIDSKNGELRWAFVPDPYVNASVFTEDPAVPGKAISKQQIIGEQYMPMISHWYKPAKATFVGGYLGMGGAPGGACNNDVHEIFKCIGEVMLENAYVLERADGTFQAWNCSINKGLGAKLTIALQDKCITRVHFNLKNAHKVEIKFAGGKVEGEIQAGMRWVGPGGDPFHVRKFTELIGNGKTAPDSGAIK